MKKSLVLFFLLMSFVLVGCGSKTSKDTNEIINNSNNDKETDTNNDDIKLYSSSDRLVFNANNLYYIVVDFGSDNKATGLKWIYNYQDEKTAALMVAMIKTNLEDEDDVKSVTQDGKYIVVEYEKSAYEDMERATTEAAFSMYEKVNEE